MLVLFLILLLGIIAFFKTDVKDKFIKPKYEEVIKSDIDYDSDGLDDYTDILNGAKEFISTKPKYKSKYYDGGYPTDEYRVCTDIIWYALKNAGYDFKTLIDEDFPVPGGPKKIKCVSICPLATQLLNLFSYSSLINTKSFTVFGLYFSVNI